MPFLRIVGVILFAVVISSAASRQVKPIGVEVQPIFETPDEVVLRLVVTSTEPMDYVIRSKDRSGESAAYNRTKPVGREKRCEAISWIVMSRITPNGEKRTFEKILIQHGATNATALSTNIRELSETKPIQINRRKNPNKPDIELNEPLEIVRSNELRITLTAEEQLPNPAKSAK